MRRRRGRWLRWRAQALVALLVMLPALEPAYAQSTQDSASIDAGAARAGSGRIAINQAADPCNLDNTQSGTCRIFLDLAAHMRTIGIDRQRHRQTRRVIRDACIFEIGRPHDSSLLHAVQNIHRT